MEPTPTPPAPAAVPTSFWGVVWAVVRNTMADGWVYAGNIAYLALVTIMPLLILIMAVAAALGQGGAGAEAIDALLQALPQRVEALFRPVVEEVLAARVGNLLWLGGLVAIWTVTTFIETLRDVIRQAYGTPPERGFLRSRLRSSGGLLVAVFLTTLLFVSQVLLGLFLATIQQIFPYESVPGWVELSQLISRLVTPIALFLILWALFHILAPPSMRQFRSWPGALLTCVAWVLLAQVAIPLWSAMGNMGLTYGALSGVMLALLFFYVVGIALVAGAELNAVLARASSSV